MSVNVYLNNKVRELAGFKSQRYKDDSGDKMTFNGMHVFGENGRLYLMWNIEDAIIPDEFKDLVEEISCYETIPVMSGRESGIYRHESAECELTPEDYGSSKRERPVYKLKLRAKKLEDIKVLMHKVKTGTICPEESYEERQGGKTRQQLESELLQTQLLLGEARTTAEELREELKLANQSFVAERRDFSSVCEKNVLIRKLTYDLLGKSADSSIFCFCWPFVNRRRVVEKITNILDGTK